MTSPVIAIVGPTAVGKSHIAMALAQTINGAIVAADSRQVYRYMDIGTAKPTVQDRALVPHYMIDLVAPDEPFSAYRYRREGLRVLRRLEQAGKPAIVTGGTGFYVRSLLDGIAPPHVPPNQEVRQRLHAEADTLGRDALHRRLQEVDPRSAARIHPSNVQRIIRALEIVEHLQGPVPSVPREVPIPALFIGLTIERAELYSIADQRVIEQMDAGLVEETGLLLKMGFRADTTALDGFGYRQMVAHLNGRISLEQAVVEYQGATRAYIRRQMTWFRGDARIAWLDPREDALRQVESLVQARFTSTSWM